MSNMDLWLQNEILNTNIRIDSLAKRLGDKAEGQYSTVRSRLDNIEEDLQLFKNSIAKHTIDTTQQWKEGIFYNTVEKNGALILSKKEFKWNYVYEANTNMEEANWTFEDPEYDKGQTTLKDGTINLDKARGDRFAYTRFDDLINNNKGFSMRMRVNVTVDTSAELLIRTGAYKADIKLHDNYMIINNVMVGIDLKKLRTLEFRCDLQNGYIDLWIDGAKKQAGIALATDYTDYPKIRLGNLNTTESMTLLVDDIRYTYDYAAEDNQAFNENGYWISPILNLGNYIKRLEHLEIDSLNPEVIKNIAPSSKVYASSHVPGNDATQAANGTIYMQDGWVTKREEVNNAWIQFEFNEPRDLTSVRVYNGYPASTHYTTAFSIYGSEDGDNYQLLMRYEKLNKLQWVTWEVPDTQPLKAKYIRIQDFESTDDYIRLGEVEIFGHAKTSVRAWISTGQYSNNMSGWKLLAGDYSIAEEDIQYLRLKMELLTEDAELTPMLEMFSAVYRVESYDKIISDVERKNTIHLAKMNFKVNTVLNQSKYSIVNMEIDDFVDNVGVYEMNNLVLSEGVLKIGKYQWTMIKNGDWSERTSVSSGGIFADMPTHWEYNFTNSPQVTNTDMAVTPTTPTTPIEYEDGIRIEALADNTLAEFKSPVFTLTDYTNVYGGYIKNDSPAVWTLELRDANDDSLMDSWVLQGYDEWNLNTQHLARKPVYLVFRCELEQNGDVARVYMREVAYHYPSNVGYAITHPITLPMYAEKFVLVTSDIGSVSYDVSYNGGLEWNSILPEEEVTVPADVDFIMIRATIYEDSKWSAYAIAFI